MCVSKDGMYNMSVCCSLPCHLHIVFVMACDHRIPAGSPQAGVQVNCVVSTEEVGTLKAQSGQYSEPELALKTERGQWPSKKHGESKKHIKSFLIHISSLC